MNEIQPVEGMARVLDPAIHVNAAVPAGVSLDRRGRIHGREFMPVRGHADVLPRHDRDLREHRALGLPALRAAADVIVRALPLDRHLDGVLIALAHKGPAREILRPGFHTLIHGRVD